MAAAQPEVDPEFEALLEYLKEMGGHDFTGYKRSSLMRRVEKRMTSVGAASYSNYRDYLAVQPDESEQLLRAVLINVTEFFRDPASWDYLSVTIIPRLHARREGRTIRVWSAACATGEEAYSLMMAFADVLGIDAVRDRLTIIASDIDSDALDRARAGCYLRREVGGVSETRLERYFVLNDDDRLTFREDLRCIIDFRRHDMILNDPIDSVDLLVCRNALMYFNSDVQAAVVQQFHDAVTPDGYLFLGRADMLLSYGHLFTPVELRRRVFARTSHPDATPGARKSSGYFGETRRTARTEDRRAVFRLETTAAETAPEPPSPSDDAAQSARSAVSRGEEFHWLRDALVTARRDVQSLTEELTAVLAASPSAVVVVDNHQRIVRLSPAAAQLWEMSAHDAVGRSLRTLRLGESVIACVAAVLAGSEVGGSLPVQLGARRYQCSVHPTVLTAHASINSSANRVPSPGEGEGRGRSLESPSGHSSPRSVPRVVLTLTLTDE